MALINVYLTFNGNCEEAFNFYKSIFGGDFAYVGRFKDVPPQDGKDLSPADANLIMHVALPISKETILMGSDFPSHYGKVVFGNNFSISLSADSRDKADAFFKSLSTGGQTAMPMSDTFWGSYFGMLTDKYGINWMVSYDKGQMTGADKKMEAAAK
jgi:PhnB protein